MPCGTEIPADTEAVIQQVFRYSYPHRNINGVRPGRICELSHIEYADDLCLIAPSTAAAIEMTEK